MKIVVSMVLFLFVLATGLVAQSVPAARWIVASGCSDNLFCHEIYAKGAGLTYGAGQNGNHTTSVPPQSALISGVRLIGNIPASWPNPPVVVIELYDPAHPDWPNQGINNGPFLVRTIQVLPSDIAVDVYFDRADLQHVGISGFIRGAGTASLAEGEIPTAVFDPSTGRLCRP